jgi:hypothetical protein
MKTMFVASRILLGLIFLAAGLSGFILLGNAPPAPPGLAGEFQRVFFQSHWVVLVDGVEFLAGALLIANRYMLLALAGSAFRNAALDNRRRAVPIELRAAVRATSRARPDRLPDPPTRPRGSMTTSIFDRRGAKGSQGDARAALGTKLG